MPILAPEPALFPEDLLDVDSPPGEGGRDWWVLQTRPRQEKSVARDLLDLGVRFYLPLLDRRTMIRGRVFKVQDPLFTGYVFLLGGEQERVAALATRRVARALPVVDQPRLWHDLRQLRRLLVTGGPVTPEHRLVPGTVVEILTGPLAGLRGEVLRVDSRRRFVVGVEMMRQGVSVLLDEDTQVRVVPGEVGRAAEDRGRHAR
jgi:transcriptional antiterminator RfaH